MTKEEIISILSKELNSEWTNGVTCLMVENSDSYIPVIVHHNKNELIVEVGEQDKKIRLIAEQIEKLGVDHGDQEVKGAVRITHDEKQRRFSVAQLVQFQLIVHGGIPDFLNIEGCEPGTAGNKDRLGRFARN